MDRVPTPAWILPVWAVVQVWLGTMLVAALRDPDAWSGPVYATLTTGASVLGAAAFLLAARNCVRLWRRDPTVPGSGIVWSAVPVAVVCALSATVPLVSGEWRWWTIGPAVLAVVLVAILVRDARARPRRRSRAAA